MKSAVSVNKKGVVTEGRNPRKIGVVSPPGHFGPVQLNVKLDSRAINPLTIEDPFVEPLNITPAQLFSLEGKLEACIDFFRYCCELGKPSITQAPVLQGWAHGFRADAKRLLRIEPFLQRNRRRIVNG